VELSESADRILRAHRKLIIGLGLAGAVVAFSLHLGDLPAYSATSRFVLDSTGLSAQTGAAVIADTASAIATSPAQVSRALRAIGASRDPAVAARDHVKVQTLGTSGVLRLTVTDESPTVAASLANALTREVIAVTTHISNGRVSQTLDALASQIDSLTNRIHAADRRMNTLTSEIAATALPSRVAVLQSTLTDLVQLRDALAQSRTLLQSEQANIVATDATRPQATVVQPATPPVTADPGSRLPDIVLGALLGLFLGVGVAAVMEIVHPTVVGRSSMAREMGAPVLGELPAPPDQLTSPGVADVASRVGLAASSRGVDHVQLLGVTGTALETFALLLKEGVRNRIWADVEPSAASASPGARRRATNDPSRHEANGRANFTVGVVGASSPPSRSSRNRIGLLLVLPMAVPRSQLTPIEHFTEISRWPVIGVVGYRETERFNWRVASRSRHRGSEAKREEGTG
jgi:capsular polysaccharide biosynthesis protein